MLSMVSQYAPMTIGGMGVGGRKRVLSRSEDQQSRKRQKQLQVEPEEADRHAFRVHCFREMCLRHEGASYFYLRRLGFTDARSIDFLNCSTAVDGYLLAMASLYLKRAGLNTCGYTKDRYLFYALYLAIGTFFFWHYSVFARQAYSLALLFLAEPEEDLPRGAEEILLYLLGPLPSSAKGEGPSLLRSTQQLEWDTRLSRFLAGKDKVQL
jgi:hypothetical protein